MISSIKPVEESVWAHHGHHQLLPEGWSLSQIVETGMGHSSSKDQRTSEDSQRCEKNSINK